MRSMLLYLRITAYNVINSGFSHDYFKFLTEFWQALSTHQRYGCYFGLSFALFPAVFQTFQGASKLKDKLRPGEKIHFQIWYEISHKWFFHVLIDILASTSKKEVEADLRKEKFLFLGSRESLIKKSATSSGCLETPFIYMMEGLWFLFPRKLDRVDRERLPLIQMQNVREEILWLSIDVTAKSDIVDLEWESVCRILTNEFNFFLICKNDTKIAHWRTKQRRKGVCTDLLQRFVEHDSL